MATNNTESLSFSGDGHDDWVPPNRLACARVDAWSRVSKNGDPIRLPPLGRTCKQVFSLHCGMLDWKRPAGPLTGEHGFGPTQQSIATLVGIHVRTVKLAEKWLADPWTVREASEYEVKRRGKPTITVKVLRDVPADTRGRPVPGGRVPWTEADGLRHWRSFIQIFDAEKIPGGGGGRRRRICVHPHFYASTTEAFKACTELPDWAGVDITKYDIGMTEEEEPTRDELVEMFRRDNELSLKNGELSSPFQTTTVRLNGPRHAKERALARLNGRFCLVPT